MRGGMTTKPIVVMVPALYNVLPAETVAMGWLNEIDALASINPRLSCAAKITGWDVFTFHTLHNLDPYFNTTIDAVQDTWLKEGTLCVEAVAETKRRFGKPCDYYSIAPRLVENLVFQSSLLDWISRHSPEEIPPRLQVVGTALVSALVSSGAITFESAVKSALKFGQRWDDTVMDSATGNTEEQKTWARFDQIRKLIQGRSSLSLGVARDDMPVTNAPKKPFWYSPSANEPAVLISTAPEAKAAFETMNLSSWSRALPKRDHRHVRGWLVSPLHPIAKACRWSVSNYLLATPESAHLFLDHIAVLGRGRMIHIPEETPQNRFRLSRVKVTGP
jgi:hypothetical protein